MGYCMSYRRALNRNGLFGTYRAAGGARGSYGEAPLDSEGAALATNPANAAGDLRRVELDQRDDRHLAAYAAYAGITPEQARRVLDAFFDGAPNSGFDCIH
jgi:hypothetical protein